MKFLQDLPVKRDLTRFVKWPKYVNRQRQKVVLKKRLRVPPAINQFSNTVDRHLKKEVMKFALKYKPEDKATKRVRLTKWAKAQLHSKSRSKPVPAKNQVTYGIQQVTRLVERKRAKLVLIAHDVDPIELVLFMPTLCKKMVFPHRPLVPVSLIPPCICAIFFRVVPSRKCHTASLRARPCWADWWVRRSALAWPSPTSRARTSQHSTRFVNQ